MKPTVKKPTKCRVSNKRLILTEQNYISYNELSSERRAFFLGTGLQYYLILAEKVLFGSKVHTIHNQFDTDKPFYCEEKIAIINTYIEYVLTIVAISNERFGATADKQHKFFHRIGEQEGFFTHLFFGMQTVKRVVFKEKIPEGELLYPYIEDLYLELEAYREGEIYFKIQGKPVSENEIFAAGIFYAVNFLFDAVEKADALRFSRVSANLLNFALGTSYKATHGKKGGSKLKTNEINNKERGYQIFLENNIYDKCNGKHAAMAEALHALLKKTDIKIAGTTVEKKWIPDFVKRIQNP